MSPLGASVVQHQVYVWSKPDLVHSIHGVVKLLMMVPRPLPNLQHLEVPKSSLRMAE
jgi:hypothetical protein